MSRKREPMAYIGAEDYRIVRHTHDVDLAKRLMRERLIAEYGCPGDGKSPDGFCRPIDSPDCPHMRVLGTPKQVYVRIQGAIPGSFAESEGWRYAYHEVNGPGRGAFKAVVFR